MELKSATFEVKDISLDGSFAGYGSVFGNVDSYGDIVEKGAFAESLNEFRAKGKMPALLWQHDPDQPIGVWTKMAEDERGLYVEGHLLKDDVSRAREAYSLLKAGALSGLSIGYVTKDSEYDRTEDVRRLKALDLWEVSLVTFPANGEAQIQTVKSLCAKGLPTIREFETWLRDAGGFDRAQAKAIASHGFKAIERDAQATTTDEDLASSLSKFLNSIKG